MFCMKLVTLYKLQKIGVGKKLSFSKLRAKVSWIIMKKTEGEELLIFLFLSARY